MTLGDGERGVRAAGKGSVGLLACECLHTILGLFCRLEIFQNKITSYI